MHHVLFYNYIMYQCLFLRITHATWIAVSNLVWYVCVMHGDDRVWTLKHHKPCYKLSKYIEDWRFSYLVIPAYVILCMRLDVEWRMEYGMKETYFLNQSDEYSGLHIFK